MKLDYTTLDLLRKSHPVGGRIAQEQVDQFPQEWVPQFRRNTHTCNGQK